MKRASNSILKSRPLRSAGRSTVAAVATLVTANAVVIYNDSLNASLASAKDKSGAAPLVSQAITIAGTAVFDANLRSSVNGKGFYETISIVNYQNGFGGYGFTIFSDTRLRTFAAGDIIPGEGAVSTDPFFNLIFFGYLNPGETAFIGFSFNPSGSQDLFGWIEFRMDKKDAGDTGFTLTRYAYEDSGAFIEAGAVPEPSGPLLLSLAGLMGLLKRRRPVA